MCFSDLVAQLLDSIPEDVPVLIDEAYHHFVEDPSYATSLPYVLQGRQVIIARTFSAATSLRSMPLSILTGSPYGSDRTVSG